jgi:hypothetical protein
MRVTITLVGLALCLGLTTIVGSGLAANRDGVATLEGVPGPSRVTYGKNVGYRSKFQNTSASGVFTHTTFTMKAPLADGVEAQFVAASCGDGTTSIDSTGRRQYVCDFGQLRASDPPLLVTIVWRAPDLSSGHPTCTTTSPCSMSGTATWSVKERASDQPDINDSFSAGPVTTVLLAQPDPAEAGGFLTTGSSTSPTLCQSTTSPSLESNQLLGTGNRLSTRICVPPFTAGPALGVATKIDEAATSETGIVTEISTVCVADLGAGCGTDSPFDFGTPTLVSVFRVPDSALPSGARLRTWFHQPDGAPGPLTAYPLSASCTGGQECAAISYSGKTKIWTIVALTTTNGRYGGG